MSPNVRSVARIRAKIKGTDKEDAISEKSITVHAPGDSTVSATGTVDTPALDSERLYCNYNNRVMERQTHKNIEVKN